MTTPRRTIRVSNEEWATWRQASGGNVTGWLRELATRELHTDPPCQHQRKRTGISGLRVCDDCGKVNP
jgi:hypothetical protein